MEMEKRLIQALGVESARKTGSGGRGWINEGETYELDDGRLVFVKFNSKDKARLMFDGEYESLKAIESTKTIRVPHPIKVLDLDRGAALVMENMNFSGRNMQEVLGRQLALLHRHESDVKATLAKEERRVNKCGEGELFFHSFGFHVPTSCGYLPMDNTWSSSWPEFFARQRLKVQVDMIEREHGDRDLWELWSQLVLIIPKFFEGLEIVPSLLHGDLWSGNVSEADGVPVIYDPASFYGHSEYEMGIMNLFETNMFGGFRQAMDAYFEVLPKHPGFDKRAKLYELFHHLNHWNHFGSGYRDGSLDVMRSLVNAFK